MLKHVIHFTSFRDKNWFKIRIIYTSLHLAKIEIVPEAVIEVIWLDKLCLNCIFDFSPCNYSWICDGIKRDLLSSSSTYVDTMKRVKGEKFQHNFLASLWVFIFFPCSQTNQTFPIFDPNYCLCHSRTSYASPMLLFLLHAIGHLHLNNLNEYNKSNKKHHAIDFEL